MSLKAPTLQRLYGTDLYFENITKQLTVTKIYKNFSLKPANAKG